MLNVRKVNSMLNKFRLLFLWLKVALVARGVPHSERFTLHSLRRGAAQALLGAGGDLSTLLAAGGWRSNAFKNYIDQPALESAVVNASLGALFVAEELD